MVPFDVVFLLLKNEKNAHHVQRSIVAYSHKQARNKYPATVGQISCGTLSNRILHTRIKSSYDYGHTSH